MAEPMDKINCQRTLYPLDFVDTCYSKGEGGRFPYMDNQLLKYFEGAVDNLKNPQARKEIYDVALEALRVAKLTIEGVYTTENWNLITKIIKEYRKEFEVDSSNHQLLKKLSDLRHSDEYFRVLNDKLAQFGIKDFKIQEPDSFATPLLQLATPSEAKSFFAMDLHKSLSQFSATNPGGYVCAIVGKTRVPMTKPQFEELYNELAKFEVEHLKRNVPNFCPAPDPVEIPKNDFSDQAQLKAFKDRFGVLTSCSTLAEQFQGRLITRAFEGAIEHYKQLLDAPVKESIEKLYEDFKACRLELQEDTNNLKVALEILQSSKTRKEFIHPSAFGGMWSTYVGKPNLEYLTESLAMLKLQAVQERIAAKISENEQGFRPLPDAYQRLTKTSTAIIAGTNEMAASLGTERSNHQGEISEVLSQYYNAYVCMEYRNYLHEKLEVGLNQQVNEIKLLNDQSLTIAEFKTTRKGMRLSHFDHGFPELPEKETKQIKTQIETLTKRQGGLESQIKELTTAKAKIAEKFNELKGDVGQHSDWTSILR